MGLIDHVGPGTVALDASAFIYYVEEHPEYVTILDPLFDEVVRGEREIVTSGVTLLEVLVVPLRLGNVALAARYESLLTRGLGVHLVEIDREQLRMAATLRARHNVRTPDALQLAAALTTGCRAFVTNDNRLRDLPGLRVIQLRDVA
ncbi:MAG: type II toxin-antitoxin system VapC family toxin [Gemmatirosa sp.]|nr:type II toxin-antitoxin system VapC family toxin [Gemmatirosa sp.]